MQDTTDPYPTPEAISDQVNCLEEDERFADLFKKDLIAMAGVVGRRKLRRIHVAPYAEALMKRGLMKGEPRENISPEVEEGMMFSVALAVEIAEGMANLGDEVTEGKAMVDSKVAVLLQKIEAVDHRGGEMAEEVQGLKEHREHVQVVEASNAGWRSASERYFDQVSAVLQDQDAELAMLKEVARAQTRVMAVQSAMILALATQVEGLRQRMDPRGSAEDPIVLE